MATNVIDHFFHSIAEDQGDRGVGIILSGAGSDGTPELKAISDRGELIRPVDARVRISQHKGTVVGAPAGMLYRSRVMARPKHKTTPLDPTDLLAIRSRSAAWKIS